MATSSVAATRGTSRGSTYSVYTTTAATTSPTITLSQARQSLRSAGTLDRPEFKGDKLKPPYTIDPDVEGSGNSVDRSDDDLSVLELGKKYMEVFGDVEMVLADLSGNMFEDLLSPLKPYNGVKEAFDLIKEHGLKRILLANSWNASKKSILELLRKGGFNVEEDDVFTSSDACKIHMKENNLKSPYYLVHEDVLEDFAEEFPRCPDEDVVIVGLPSTQFDYRLLSKGMHLLINGAPLITLSMQKREISPNVYNSSLGSGPFVSMLEVCTDAEPVTVCKPYKKFYDILCARLGCPDFSKIVVVGDDITEDIVGAKALGMKAILTRTGSYQANDEKTVCSGVAPDATAENFVMAIRCILASLAVSQMSEEDFIEEDKSSRGCGTASSIPKDDQLSRKVEAYINTQPKSKMERVENLVKMPSYVW